MDIALHYFDEYVGDRLYSVLDNPFSKYAPTAASKLSLDTSSPSALLSSAASYLGTLPSLSSLDRDSVVRQLISLFTLTYVGIFVLYFSVATFSYYYIFDHRMKLHPRYLKDQVRKEIYFSLEAFPGLILLTLPWFLGDVRGYSQLYDTIEEGPFGERGGVLPWVYMAGSAAFFLWFTDFAIYWVHRWLHIPFLYKRLHKPHHKWISKSRSLSCSFLEPLTDSRALFDSSHSFRLSCFPPSRWIPSISSLPHGMLHVPNSQVHVCRTLLLCQLLVNLCKLPLLLPSQNTFQNSPLDIVSNKSRSMIPICYADTPSSTTSTDPPTTLSTTSTSPATMVNTLLGPTNTSLLSEFLPRATTHSSRFSLKSRGRRSSMQWKRQRRKERNW